MRGGKLSIGQKAKELFHSSKVPHYSFSLEVELPTRLQLGNPATIPVRLHAIPDSEHITENLRSVTQAVFIRRFVLQIESLTEFKAAGTISDQIESSATRTVIARYEKPKDDGTFNPDYSTFHEEKGQPPPADVLTIPQRHDDPCLDLGHALKISLRKYSSILSADFTTYNIKHTHRLHWSVGLVIAGKDKSAEGIKPISVLGPSYDQLAA